MSNCAHAEPTIEEIMADPTIHALMRADRVDVDCLRFKLQQKASTWAANEPFALRPVRTMSTRASLAPLILRETVRG